MSGRFQDRCLHHVGRHAVICSLRPALWIRPLRERDAHTAFAKSQPVSVLVKVSNAVARIREHDPDGKQKAPMSDGASDKTAVAVRDDRRCA